MVTIPATALQRRRQCITWLILRVRHLVMLGILLVSCRNADVAIYDGSLDWKTQLRVAQENVRSAYPHAHPVLTDVSATVLDGEEVLVVTRYRFRLSPNEYTVVSIAEQAPTTVLYPGGITHQPQHGLVALSPQMTAVVKITPFDAFMLTQREVQNFEERHISDVVNKSIRLTTRATDQAAVASPVWEVEVDALVEPHVYRLVIVIDAVTGDILEQQETLLAE